MNHKIEFLGMKQVSYQLDIQTTAMFKWDVATVRVPDCVSQTADDAGQQSVLRGGALVFSGGPSRETWSIGEFKFHATDEHPRRDDACRS